MLCVCGHKLMAHVKHLGMRCRVALCPCQKFEEKRR